MSLDDCRLHVMRMHSQVKVIDPSFLLLLLNKLCAVIIKLFTIMVDLPQVLPEVNIFKYLICTTDNKQQHVALQSLVNNITVHLATSKSLSLDGKEKCEVHCRSGFYK